MPDRTAKDIMIPLGEYASVSPEDSLARAILVLMENLPRGHRSLAVLEEGRLVGFLTTRTILNALEVYGFEEKNWDRITWGNFFTRKEKDRLKNVGVRKIMRPAHDIYLDEDTPLGEVTRTLLRKQVNHIPVRNGKGRLVGIIRTIDVLDVLAGLL
jgi:CBS domain-containing protein